MIWTVGFRYVGIALQFLLLTVLARHLDAHAYGQYLFVLSAVLPTYFLLGLGASETVVREGPVLLQTEGGRAGGELRRLVGAGLVAALGSASLLVAVGAAVLSLPVVDAGVTPWFMLTFFVANGLMFNAAQILLGIGEDRLGAFFFYPALNVTLLGSAVPYMLLARDPSFTGIATVTSVASVVAAAVALGVVLSRIRPARSTGGQLRHVVRVGIRLAAARAFYAAGLWLPTFVAGLLLSPVEAGYLGTAGRLAVAVAAVMAAVRFAVRPSIVRAFHEGDTERIRLLCGSLATISSGLAVIALVLNLVLGRSVVTTVFGSSFAPVAPLLSLLLVGIIAECVAGPVDEVLKMTGHEGRVLVIFTAALPLLVLGLLAGVGGGIEVMAGVQVIYSVVVFGSMIVAVRLALGIWLRPSVPARLGDRLHRRVPTRAR